MFKKEFDFPGIFARILLKDKLAPAALKQKFSGKVPYDAFFPSQQEVVEEHMMLRIIKFFLL